MPYFICTSFEGFWPVGTAAVARARTEHSARRKLDAALKGRGLPGLEDGDELERLELEDGEVRILRDGDY